MPGCDCLASSSLPPNSCFSVVPAQSHHTNRPTTESPQSSLSHSTSHLPRLLALLFIIANIKGHHPPPPLNVKAQNHLSSRPHRLDLIVGCRVYFLLFNPAFGLPRGWVSLTPFILLTASQNSISLEETRDGDDAVVVVPKDKIPIDPPGRTSQPIRISYRRHRPRSRCRCQRSSWSRWTGSSTPSSCSCTAA